MERIENNKMKEGLMELIAYLMIDFESHTVVLTGRPISKYIVV